MIKIVSLVPSVTETLLAWDIEPVACTRFCEQPALRHVGGTKDPDIAAIVALRPDLVVVDQEENRREDADALANAGIEVHVMHVTSLAEVEPMLAVLAARVGAPPPPPAALPTAREQVVARAFVPIWRRPWMTINADTYGSSMLASCGVANVFDDHVDRYPTVTLEMARAAQPDMVILPSEPYPFTARHVPSVRSVATDVRLVDGRDLFWWGARTRRAMERLAQAMSSS